MLQGEIVFIYLLFPAGAAKLIVNNSAARCTQAGYSRLAMSFVDRFIHGQNLLMVKYNK